MMKEKIFKTLKEHEEYVRASYPNTTILGTFLYGSHFSENIKKSGWNTIQHYLQTNKRDKIKNNLALQNNIPLVRIPYWERYNITLDMLLRDNIFLVS